MRTARNERKIRRDNLKLIAIYVLNSSLKLKADLCIYSIYKILEAMSRTLGSIYVVEHLKPLTTYEFRFATRNDVGQSNWGTNLEQTTPGRTVPTQPKILTTPGSEYEQSAFNNQYELSWLTPLDNGEPIDMYRIKYCQIRQVAGEWEVLDNTCVEIKSQGRTRQYLKSLSPDTIYRVELQAHNIMGYSTAGVAKFRTARGKSATFAN